MRTLVLFAMPKAMVCPRSWIHQGNARCTVGPLLRTGPVEPTEALKPRDQERKHRFLSQPLAPWRPAALRRLRSPTLKHPVEGTSAVVSSFHVIYNAFVSTTHPLVSCSFPRFLPPQRCSVDHPGHRSSSYWASREPGRQDARGVCLVDYRSPSPTASHSRAAAAKSFLETARLKASASR